MATTKKVVADTPVKPLPKPFELGFKFLVEAEITDIETTHEWPYEVTVVLSDDGGCSEKTDLNFSKEQLIRFISKTNPKFKKDYITQQLKDAKALVASLEKQLAAN